MATQNPEPPRKRRVLVVDDHIDAAHSLAVLLRHMGHEVQYAINGYSALELADRFHPDILFVDMVLPDFHGSDLSKRIRSNLHPRRIRVVAVTGHNSEHTRTRAEQAGCDEYLTKPLDFEKVERAIEDAPAAP